jgi:hypothetical protein
MAYQLEVVRFRDLLPVLAIPGFVKGLTPRMVELRGADFSSAERVNINETPSPEFMIVNKTTIYAQLPDSNGPLSSIEVLSSKFSRDVESALLSFEIGGKTRKVEGILKLVQLFTKWILQSPGSDLFNPSRGGGLQQIVGKVTTGKDMQPVFASITRAVNATVSQIRAAQINVSELPLSERLLSANLLDMKVYEEHMQARARVSLQSVGGAEAVAALVL